MNLLDKLERRFRRYAVPNVTVGLIAVQVLVLGMSLASTGADEGETAAVVEGLQLVPNKVLEGEVWRLVTFLAVPPMTNLLFAFFFFYLFYLMGTAIEHYWGAFRYNVFLLIGYVATIAAAFVVPDLPATNGFLQGSVFLAFAALNPDFQLHLFFILPVKIKWLALLTCIGYFLAVAFGGWQMRLLVLASVANLFVFFGRDIYYRLRAGRRQMARQASRMTVKEPQHFHICAVCGITDRTDPQMDFRYCSQCEGDLAYCTYHLKNHPHMIASEDNDD